MSMSDASSTWGSILAEASAQLAEARERHSLLAIACEAAAALLDDGPERGVALLLGAEHHLTVVRALGVLSPYQGQQVDATTMPAGVRATLSLRQAARWSAGLAPLGFAPLPAPPEGDVLIVPVAARGTTQGLLVVAGPGISEAAPFLKILAAQLGLALDGLGLVQWVEAAVEQSSDLVLVLDADATIRLANPAAHHLLGWDREGLAGAPLVDLLEPAEAETVLSLLGELASGRADEHRGEVRLRHAEGRGIDVEASFRSLLRVPEVQGIVLTGRDVRERKSLEAQLAHWALHDPLTNLANRVLLRDRLTRASGNRAGVAVLLVDLDDFKGVNDSLGHHEGDRLLVAVADRLRRCARSSDTVARLGGDEFVVLAQEIHAPEDAAALAGRIMAALDEPFHVGALELRVTASVGIRMTAGEHADPDQLLRDADLAMYSAKAQGKAAWAVFEPVMHAAAEERLATRSALRQAIDNGEFRLHYQPIVEVDSGRLTGMEALIRWQHPTRGLLGPHEFIGHAEDTGLIVPLGAWVLRTACRQLARFHAADPTLTMSVNLSVRQLESDDVIGHVRAALEESGVAPAALTLEITEGLLIAEGAPMVHRLGELKALGVKLAIDDFGTGFSSLGYLQHLPVDIIKIDRSFVEGLNGHGSQMALVNTIIRLSEALRLETVAEGVETASQLAALRSMECRYAQGYYFARPLDEQALTAYLLDQLTAPSSDAPPPAPEANPSLRGMVTADT
jgi:diguanylate cyclase (GGDEF)-like protein/PAS domain S-box-containing protein